MVTSLMRTRKNGSMTTPEDARNTRTRGRIWATVVLGIGWLTAFAVIRLGLDWSDSLPYEGAITERRYLVIAASAIVIAALSTLFGIVAWRRTRIHPND